MKKKRLIPVLMLKDGWIIQSKEFHRFQNLGNPITSVKRVSEWGADELIYLDISREGSVYDLRREDIKHPNRENIVDIINDLSKVCFVPITIGGGIKDIEDIRVRLAAGADKIAINTMAVLNTNLISEASKVFGSQCIVVSVDYKKNEKGQEKVYIRFGTEETKFSPLEWCKIAEGKGAGEILLNSIERDGMSVGYDLQLLNEISKELKIPVIGLGGAGMWEDLSEVMEETNIDAVAAANIFHYSDQSVFIAKKHLYNCGLPVRKPILLKLNINH
jgi:cyclase